MHGGYTKVMLSLLLLATQPLPALEIGFDGRQGLSIKANGVPVVRGSYLQVFEPDWSKGHYSSFNSPMEVSARHGGRHEARFKGPEGQVEGTVSVVPTPAGAKVRLRVLWNGPKPARAEWCAGLVWLPAFRGGKVAGSPLAAAAPTAATAEGRAFGPAREAWRFEGGIGALAGIGPPSTAFDARGYGQPWAAGRDLAWVGVLSLDLAPGKWTEVEYRWSFSGPRPAPDRTDSATLRAEPAEAVISPPTERPLLIPTPKTDSLEWDKPVPLDPRGLDELLAHRWVLSGATGLVVRRSLNDLGLPAEGYEIEADANGIAVRGQDEAGLAHGLRRLAAVAFAHEGRLVVPSGRVRDWPTTRWRGVHLFVGPTALRFHEDLWGRALLDLGFNKALIQCERAAWQSLPGIGTEITMPRADLAALFEWYRAHGVEPIPLVQSFGHMEWFFANGQNRDARLNPDVPYSVDPRKPATREKLTALWDEVAGLLKPSTMHFGLDEVDMRGWPGDPELVTDLWESHVAFLGQIASKHGATMMLWGDNALAPGEAVDATHGHSAEHAARRRAAIPKGAIVTDWHYRADPDPATFAPSLDVWRRDGIGAIASVWYRPENVRGFGAAAALKGDVGLLQTTWAGYESGMEGLLREWRQFAVMALAGEVAWTGNPAQPAWSFEEVFARLLFGRARPLAPVPGLAYGDGYFETIAGVRLRGLNRSLRGVLSGDTRHAPTALRFSLGAPAGRVVLAIDCAEAADDGEAVAVVSIDGAETPLLYGRHLRTRSDDGPTLFAPREKGVSVVTLDAPAGVQTLEIRALNPATGLRVRGIATYRSFTSVSAARHTPPASR